MVKYIQVKKYQQYTPVIENVKLYVKGKLKTSKLYSTSCMLNDLNLEQPSKAIQLLSKWVLYANQLEVGI